MGTASGTRRAHAWVSGIVQGVWFRAGTRAEGERLGLSGWVRNLDDGRVELVAEGPGPQVEALLAWARHGPPGARVDRLEVAEEPPVGEPAGFVVRRP